MIYTKKSPALLIIGVVMLLWGGLNASGTVDGMQKSLQKSAYSDHLKIKEKFDAELRVARKSPTRRQAGARDDHAQVQVRRGQGAAGAAQLHLRRHRHRARSADPGLEAQGGPVRLLPVDLSRHGLHPAHRPHRALGARSDFRQLGQGRQGALGWDFAQIFNLNYVVLGIVIGIVIVNVFRIPEWAANGVRTARFFLKTGVILLGTLYSATELAQLGGLSVIMIGIFVLGSVGSSCSWASVWAPAIR